MKSTTEILKRRFRLKKENKPEMLNPSDEFKSKFAHFTAGRYFDSDQFAFYEYNFPKNAHDFYVKSGADQFNHDSLDLDIDKHVLDEHKHIDEQLLKHLSTLEDLHIGVEVEKTSVEAKLKQVTDTLEKLKADEQELRMRYNSFNRK